ncbi:MAG TPA: NADPH-dependent FMN reductase [Alcaligenes faecalis]|nr:NADPH-dependent FMN reductase [Alcaligenes faecalis]
MSDSLFRFHDLFAQLGLPNTPEAIASFLEQHRPLPNDVLLADAPFWSESQAEFIREKRLQDSPEWIQIIDQLSEALRQTSGVVNLSTPCRVLALSGSLRHTSYNTALAQAAQTLAPQGMAIEVATLHGIPLYDGDLESKEGIPAAVLALKEKILNADALLLVTPEYNNGVPGVFKNSIDWLSRTDSKAIFAGRITGLIGASMGGFGTVSSQAAWLPTLKMLGVSLYSGGSLLVSRAQNSFDEQGKLQDENIQKMLTTYLQGFQTFVHASHMARTQEKSN